jgi:type I restriction enzyme S subunit
MIENSRKKNKLSEACSLVTDWTHDSPKLLKSWIPLIKWKNISWWFIDFHNCDYISYEDHLKVISRSNPEYW